MSKLKPYFEQCGKGSPLVLLHGWGLHGGIFEHLYPLLEDHFQVINIDLPGFGRSPIALQDYTLDYVIEQILSVAPEKAHYLGWSLGGLLASHIAIQFPERLDKLITVASSPQFLQSDDWPYAMKPEVMHNFASLLEENYESTLIRFLGIQTMGSETQKLDIQRLKETVFIHGQPASKALRGGLSLLNESELRADFKKIQAPLLRIYGRLDGLVPIKAKAMIDELSPDSKSVVIRKASHAPFLSHQDEFTSHVISFLKG